MKKFMAIMLALVLVLGMTTTASAATITITGGEDGEEYNAYKIFDVTKTSGSTTGYSYYMASNSKWVGLLKEATRTENGAEVTYYVFDGFNDGTLEMTKSADGTQYVVTAAEYDAIEFAAYLLTKTAEVATNGITADATGTAANKTVTLSDGTSTNLADGYWLVTSGIGANLVLNTTNISIADKNEYPSIEKKIDTDPNENGINLVDSTTATIGNYVYYQVTVTDATGTDEAIIVHDIMEDGLTLDVASIAVKKVTTTTTPATEEGGEDTVASVPTDLAEGVDYTVATTGLNDTCDFEITLSAATVAAGVVSANVEVEYVITYRAELNASAEIYGETDNANDNWTSNGSNTNAAWLEYSKKVTEKDPVEVYTYEFDLLKVDGSGNLLSGAEFKLYDAKTAGNVIAVVEITDDGSYRVKDLTETTAAATVIAVGDDGKTVIEGLGNGTYWLEEVTAPAGYNKLAERKEVTIENANLTDNGTAGGVRVVNQTGSELPSTGGMGTTIFYVVGGMMMAAAFVLLITRRKVASDR